MQVPSTDGVTVAVHDLGGSGAPFVIAHATGFCGRAYEPLAALLAPRFHVWALDFRGHGETPTPTTEALDWHHMTDDLEATLGALSEGPVPVFGHSMGGACALLLEKRRPGSLLWAHLFEPIVMPAGFTSSRENPMIEGAARRRATFPSRAEAMLRYAERPPLSTLRADCLRAYVQHGFRDEPDGSVTLRCAPADEATVFGNTGAATLDDLPPVHVPVTVATGALTAEFSVSSLGEAQADALLLGRLERFDHLGHLGPLQDPATIAASILAMAD